jgi:hypothetical protein
VDLRPAPAEPGLKELRKARRRNRLAHLDWADALYHAYLAAIIGGLAVTWVTGLISNEKVAPETVGRALEVGPAIVGAMLALCVAVGLRAGSRGGPLALEDPEVMHVLLAPVDRGSALIGPALKQIRTQAFVGSAIGAVVGLCALRRLPGNPVGWLVCGALIGLLGGAAWVGAALIASGRRLRPLWASVAALLILALSAADVVRETSFSPFTLAGKLALWPLHFDGAAAPGLVLLVVIPIAGLYLCAGTSLEAAKRRAGLQAQLRFAATMYDVRTVILLRRQLGQEQSRSKPWLASRSSKTSFPIVRRGLSGLMRWPLTRVLRLLALGVVAGLSCLGAWRGVEPLIFVAAIALFVAGLDAVEPLAQETDHPHLRMSFPIVEGSLSARHMIVPGVVMGLVATVGVLVLLPFEDAHTVLEVGLPMIPSAAFAAVCGAALSTTSDSPFNVAMEKVIGLEFMGMQMLVLAAWPLVVATIGLLPLLAALNAPQVQLTPGAAAMATVPFTLSITGCVLLWIRFRGGVRAAHQEALKLRASRKAHA